MLSGFHLDGILIRRDELLQWSKRNTLYINLYLACRTWQECWNIRNCNCFQWNPVPCSHVSFEFYERCGMRKPKYKNGCSPCQDVHSHRPLASLDKWKRKREQPPPLVQHSTRGVHLDSARPNIQYAYINIPNAPEHWKRA